MGTPVHNQAQTPEQRARQEIDRLLTAAGWAVQDLSAANIHTARGVAIREFPLAPGCGFADYLLYVDAWAAGTIEAKRKGAALTGVEVQSGRYAQGLPTVASRLGSAAAVLLRVNGCGDTLHQRPGPRAPRPLGLRLPPPLGPRRAPECSRVKRSRPDDATADDAGSYASPPS